MIHAIEKPVPSLLSVKSILKHLCVVTYAVPPERLRPHLPQELELETIATPQGETRALLSAVTFFNHNFSNARIPTPGNHFGQTNYRVYVQHKQQRAVWFLGTTLGTYFVHVPRVLWGMPWHHGRFHFHTRQKTDAPDSPYQQLEIEVKGGATPMHIAIDDTQQPVHALSGFATTEETLQVLTQPSVGLYAWRGSRTKIGRYSIWHDFYSATIGTLRHGYYKLLEDLEIVRRDEFQHPHSVMVQPQILYIIYLPPFPTAL